MPLLLDQALPRPVQLRVEVRSLLWLAIGSLPALLTAFVIAAWIIDHRTSLLQQHGIPAQGVIEALTGRIIDGKPFSGGRAYYRFTVPTLPGAPLEVHSGWSSVTEAQRDHLSPGSAVLVLYVPREPGVSCLGISLDAMSRSSYGLPGVLACLLGAGMFAAGTGFVWRYSRECRLLQWGCATSAMVLTVRAVARGRRFVHQANFEYRDAAGTVHAGLADRVGSTSQHVAGVDRRCYAGGDIATALYDPAHPHRADLYPMRLLIVTPMPSTVGRSTPLPIPQGDRS